MSEDTNEEEVVQALPRIRTAPEPAAAADVAALFEAHHVHVYKTARRITGNAEDAEDVLQTVFLRVARREAGALRDDEIASYLHRAATNAALDLLRRRKAARSEPIADMERLRDGAPDPESARQGTELRERVRASLASLSPRAAEIFVLRYFDGYGNREIARLLNTSWSTVAVTLHRTRAKIQKDLKGDLR